MTPTLLLEANPPCAPPFSSSPFLSPTPSRCFFSTSNNLSLPRLHYPTPIIRLSNKTVPVVPRPLPDQLRSKTIKPEKLRSKTIKPEIFGPAKELTGIQVLVDALSPSFRISCSAIIFACAVAAGYGLGFRFGKSHNAALVGALAVGAAGAGAVYGLNSSVPEVAAISLRNYVLGCDDPATINKEDIEVIAKKYGITTQNEAFNSELCDIYCNFVSSVLPPGSEDLKGHEVEAIIKFKKALGIDDPDAATMHLQIARRIFRLILEFEDRDQRLVMKKLIFVSTCVFGQASSFLLPWKRLFKYNDSQVEISIRDNAKSLYGSQLKSIGRDIDANHLIHLKESQLLYRLSDKLAEEMFKEHTRKHIEENVSAALGVIKSGSRTMDKARAVAELDKILEFNNLLISLGHSDDGRFAYGVGPVCLLGGEYDSDRRLGDLKLLYRMYVKDCLSSGCMEDNKLVALSQLRNIFGLGRQEAESIVLDITSKVYYKRIKQAVSNGDLSAADSKAAFLENLCEEIQFDTQKAIEIHEGIYRQKLQESVADGELSEDSVKALEQLHMMLCIPKGTVEAAHADICGSLFEKVMNEAISSGVDGDDPETWKSVRKAAYGLRLTREVATSIASKAVRKAFMSYIHEIDRRTESAKELKKMIAFNTSVVTKLIEAIKGESYEDPKEENITDEEEEWESSLQSLRKARSSNDGLGKTSQSEITLKDELPERDRTDLYKTYLLYCLTGEATQIPLGFEITTKKNDSEYGNLNQLGEILGLTCKEIVDVHRGLAEQAFRQEAEVILSDGQLTKVKIEKLNEVQRSVGLPPQNAQKIIKSITSTKMSEALETAVAQGKLSIKEVRELKEAGFDVHAMVSETLRENLFKKTVDGIFSSGTGDFDEQEVYEKIPKDLNVDAEKAVKVVHELARRNLSNSLIQGVACLRQRDWPGLVSSLNNLLACDKAVPSKPLSWKLPEEMVYLFSIYLKSDAAAAPEKVSRLQYLLNVSDSTA